MARANLYPPSIKPGIPTLGKKPNGWLETTFGAVLKPVYRKAKLVADQEYQLVIAKRNRGGVVPRSILKGSEIKTPTQFYICENDFLIARRQIIHGACGVVPAELDGAIVSNEYSALLVKDGLLLEYLKYFCHTTYFQQTCFQSSVGVDVEKMIFKIDHWFKWPIYLPPLPEQRKIAEILSTWDEAIAANERLLASLRQRKKGLMQRLLTGQVRFAGFDGEWRETTIGDIFTLGRGRVISNQYINEHPGSYPVYSSQSKNKGMMGAIDSYDFEGKYITWTTDGAYAGTVFYRNGKFNCTNVCGTMKPKSKDVDLRFVAYQISRITKRYVSYVGNPKLMNNIMAIVPVQLPSYEEQKKIGDILQFADDEIELLEQKLEALQQQKKGLMQRLLTGQVRVRV